MLYKVVYSIGPTDGYEIFNNEASAQDFYDIMSGDYDMRGEEDWIEIREIEE